jgi:hypothetical protein
MDDLLNILFLSCIAVGIISLIAAPFTGVTVVTAVAFFVYAWFLHKIIGGK